MPSFILNRLIPSMIALSPKISLSNLNGPSTPLELGGAKTRSMMFTCVFGGSYAFFGIMSHQDIFKIGIYVSKMNLDGQEMIKRIEDKIHEQIKLNL